MIYSYFDTKTFKFIDLRTLYFKHIQILKGKIHAWTNGKRQHINMTKELNMCSIRLYMFRFIMLTMLSLKMQLI